MLTAANSALTKPLNGDILNLHEVVGAGPAENGFYVASGPGSVSGAVLERLVELLHQESRSAASSASTAGRSSGHALTNKVGRLFWIDSGNSFDPYAVSRLAAQKGLDPRRVLRAIQVARPFTAFQFQQMMEKIPSPSLLSCDRVVQWTPLVVISDLMDLFYDSEIQDREAERAFFQFKKGLAALRERAVVLALLTPHESPASRRHFLPQILEGARRVAPPRGIVWNLPVRRGSHASPALASLPLAANSGW